MISALILDRMWSLTFYVRNLWISTQKCSTHVKNYSKSAERQNPRQTPKFTVAVIAWIRDYCLALLHNTRCRYIIEDNARTLNNVYMSVVCTKFRIFASFVR